jgi:hypothetical protein
MKLSTAQQVRLWTAGASQALALIVSLIMAGTFSYSQSLDTTFASGDLLSAFVIVVLLEIAAAALASITVWRFLRPKTVAPPVASQNVGEGLSRPGYARPVASELRKSPGPEND